MTAPMVDASLDNHTRMEAMRFLQRCGYQLVQADDGNGVWIKGKWGSSWFASFQCAAQAVGSGKSGLAQIADRCTR